MAEQGTEKSVRTAYFSALREWVEQAQMQQSFSACFPYYLMSLQNLPIASGGQGDFGLLNNNWLAGDRNGVAGPRPQPPVARQRVIDENATPAEVIAQHGGLEYVVAPLYKRCIAELIDFILLFMLKLAVTYIAVDYFNYIDVNNFDELLNKNFEDYRQAIEIIPEFIVLECIYRVLVCIFEASCLWAGGATPGKALMGIKVVSASAVLSTGVAGRVLVHPGGDITFFTAVARSLIKNIHTSLLLPLFVFLFIFQDNRMGYDVLCGVIVVEENMFPQRRNRP